MDNLKKGFVIAELWCVNSGEKKPSDLGFWAHNTIKGEINETKPKILHNIYLH